MVLALLDADGLRQLVVAGGDLVDDDPPLAVRVERSGNVVTKMGAIRNGGLKSIHHCLSQ